VCNAQVKTRDTLLQHRKKVHRLFTPIPESCVLQPEGGDPAAIKLNAIKQARGKKHETLQATLMVPTNQTLHIKEEVLPMLGEELELS